MKLTIFKFLSLELLFINPITMWMRWLLKKVYFELKHFKSRLYIGYMADVTNCSFGKHNYVYKHCHLYDVSIGDYSYISKNTQIHRADIGKFTCIGLNVLVGLGKHPSRDFASIHPLFFSSRGQIGITFMKENIFEEYERVEIGNDVWIGANVLINDGIKIGNGAIVAAGSVVTKDVMPYTVIGGVPAKFIRYRFEENEINFLQEFKWWDKDIEWLRNNKDQFRNVSLLMKIFS